MTPSVLETFLRAYVYADQTIPRPLTRPRQSTPLNIRIENGMLKTTVSVRDATHEITLDDLTPDAAKIHTRVYNKTTQAINRPFRQREVYESSELDQIGFDGISFQNTPVIVLAKKVAQQNPGLGYIYVLNANPNQRLSPAKHLEITLAHEYGHQVFREFYKTGIQEVLTEKYGVQQEKLLHGIDEAFAFWFGEEITETKTFSKTIPTTYSERCDPMIFERAYRQLRAYSNEHGIRYVLQNVSRIVEESLNQTPPKINRSIFSDQFIS